MQCDYLALPFCLVQVVYQTTPQVRTVAVGQAQHPPHARAASVAYQPQQPVAANPTNVAPTAMGTAMGVIGGAMGGIANAYSAARGERYSTWDVFFSCDLRVLSELRHGNCAHVVPCPINMSGSSWC